MHKSSLYQTFEKMKKEMKSAYLFIVGRDGRTCVGKRSILENNIYLICVC